MLISGLEHGPDIEKLFSNLQDMQKLNVYKRTFA